MVEDRRGDTRVRREGKTAQCLGVAELEAGEGLEEHPWNGDARDRTEEHDDVVELTLPGVLAAEDRKGDEDRKRRKEEKERLARLMFGDKGAINPDMVGKSPVFIAQKAGIGVPSNTSVLIAELQAVGREYPLSREKLSPVLSFYTDDGWRNACHRCIELLEFGGIGHTLVIHSKDNDIIMKFALEKPAMRILVNTQAALGAVGYTNGLDPSMTLGPGTSGGSIISENVTARHLMNIKRLAFETNPINPEDSVSVGSTIIATPLPTRSANVPTSWMEEIDRRIILKAGNTPVWKKVEETQYRKPATYGTSISAEDIDRIVSTFSKERK